MQKIEFRGKRVDNGEWVYGFLVGKVCEKGWKYPNYIIKSDGIFNKYTSEVDGETLGQYTGLRDKKGTTIFEGDVIECFEIIGKVICAQGSFGILFNEDIDYEKLDKFTQKMVGNDFRGVRCKNFIPFYELWWSLNDASDCLCMVKVIGNIHDNPNLIKNKSSE